MLKCLEPFKRKEEDMKSVWRLKIHMCVFPHLLADRKIG